MKLKFKRQSFIKGVNMTIRRQFLSSYVGKFSYGTKVDLVGTNGAKFGEGKIEYIQSMPFCDLTLEQMKYYHFNNYIYADAWNRDWLLEEMQEHYLGFSRYEIVDLVYFTHDVIVKED